MAYTKAEDKKTCPRITRITRIRIAKYVILKGSMQLLAEAVSTNAKIFIIL